MNVPRAALAILLAMSLSACKEEAEAPPPVRPVLWVKAEVRTTETLGPFAGSIQPRYSADFSFRLFGRMLARAVDIGAIVREGDELAVLDPSVQTILVRNAEASVASAAAQLANAASEEARQRPLAERNITPQAQFDLVVQNRKTAAANLARAKTSLQRAEDQLSYTRLRADFDGVVTAIYRDAGQVVNPGEKVLTVARPEVREAVIAVPSALADQLVAGATFDTVVELDQTVKMKAAGVRGVDPAADSATRTRTVYYTLTDPPAAFRLGTTVQVTLSKPVSPRIDLPATALLERGGKTQVWIIDPAKNTVALRNVAVVSRSDGSVSVTGVAAGDQVVTVGVHSLTAGQPVKLAGESST
ncbi:MAG: efflux RND transporter periplasmic adaptor subunit [Enhydrobacter sp.]|nr:efflux RND transporter periplasmic adaptor subunit [Enhydrobacter sp.]